MAKNCDLTFKKTTEESSHYDDLEQMSIHDLLVAINAEDKTVPDAVQKALPQIETLATMVAEQLKNGGRLFYAGAGTSGRLGILFGKPSKSLITSSTERIPN